MHGNAARNGAPCCCLFVSCYDYLVPNSRNHDTDALVLWRSAAPVHAELGFGCNVAFDRDTWALGSVEGPLGDQAVTNKANHDSVLYCVRDAKSHGTRVRRIEKVVTMLAPYGEVPPSPSFDVVDVPRIARMLKQAPLKAEDQAEALQKITPHNSLNENLWHVLGFD